MKKPFTLKPHELDEFIKTGATTVIMTLRKLGKVWGANEDGGVIGKPRMTRGYTYWDTEQYGVLEFEPSYFKGDTLMVREAYYLSDDGSIVYRADLPENQRKAHKWLRGNNMPEDVARHFAVIQAVGLSRLRESGTTLNDKDWNATLRKRDIGLFGWDANPWVWTIEIRKAGADHANP